MSLAGSAARASECDRVLIERALTTLETLPALERLELYDDADRMRPEVQQAASSLFGLALPAGEVVHRPQYAPFLERIAGASVPADANYLKCPVTPHRVAITRLKSRHRLTAAFIVHERFANKKGHTPARERWRVIGRNLAAREFVRDDLLRMFVPAPSDPTDLSDLVAFADGQLILAADGANGFERRTDELVLGVIADLVDLEPMLTVRCDPAGWVTVITRDQSADTGRSVRTFDADADADAAELREVLEREFTRLVPVLIERGVARVNSGHAGRLVLIVPDGDGHLVLHAVRDAFTTAWAERAGQAEAQPEHGIELHATSPTHAGKRLTDLLRQMLADATHPSDRSRR